MSLQNNTTRGLAHRKKPEVETERRFPALPSWYRRETSFVVDNETDIATFLSDLRQNNNVDCTTSESSLEGVLYKSGSQVNFSINMFEDKADNMAKTVVEFARVSGCSIEFSEFYRTMKAAFASSDIGSSEKTEAHSFMPPALSEEALSSLSAPTAETAREALTVALNISASPASSTAAEGLLLLASACAPSEFTPALLADEELSARLTETLTASLACTARGDVRVNAAAVVAKLADSDAGLAWVAEHGFVKQMQCFSGAEQTAGLTELQKNEVMRQVVHCVARAIRSSVGNADVTQEHVEFFIKFVEDLPESKRNEAAKDDAKEFSKLSLASNTQ